MRKVTARRSRPTTISTMPARRRRPSSNLRHFLFTRSSDFCCFKKVGVPENFECEGGETKDARRESELETGEDIGGSYGDYN